ncbi:DUF116 domain-containing protein [Serpentinicella alkaliphila]|uniref:Uncharacterized protein DUF116 n=1 Tax=Serpentinicella alkaliphila TaxID=1734049 RepID=A0A4R2TI87_9FIRM|nr:DUF116 domain-containing protein [Serpentinicella alkaliphila]QUH25905.1 DUF116 domain-containing protein [Serpentinicella alkaliphila]TCQ01972.1 uncharacterized protein DUF116 [Serpentinicella alkaliphila]
MDIITYSLLENKCNSNDFYKVLDLFSKEVMNKVEHTLNDVMENYRVYLINELNSPISTNEEIILDILFLSCLSYSYNGKIKNVNRSVYITLSGLSSIRGKYRFVKPIADLLKGILSQAFLSHIRKERTYKIRNLEDVNRLISWLEATGEFKEETRRIKRFTKYISMLSEKEMESLFNKTTIIGNWFEHKSNRVLGLYTKNVNIYLYNSEKVKKFKEDKIFCTKDRNLYHLNMVCSQIMNSLFRRDFLETENKVLLLPVCMTNPKNKKCMSKEFGNNFKCYRCSNTCQINMLTGLGEEWGFKVIVIPHESSISSMNIKSDLISVKTGVVGVACVLNLVSGGGLLSQMNIASQCVILDYCGCKNHWHNKGIATRINVKRLENIMAKDTVKN